MRFGGGRGRSPEEREAAERVKRLVAARLDLPPEATVTVSEIDCADPACPGMETFILVGRPGQRLVAYKLGKPTGDITEQDLHEALVGSDNG